MTNEYLTLDHDGALHASDTDLSADGSQTLVAELLPPDEPGKNRMTVWVPYDETLLNVGAEYLGAMPPALDRGISGRTTTHAHFHTTSTATSPPTATRADSNPTNPAEMIRTLTRMGAPPDSVQFTDYGLASQELQQLEQTIKALQMENMMVEGAAATFLGPAGLVYADGGSFDNETRSEEIRGLQAQILTLRDTINRAFDSPAALGTAAVEPHRDWQGYGMLTQGGAVHESRYNHILMSGEADVRVAAKETISLGTPGSILLSANPAYSVQQYWQSDGADQTNPNLPGGASFKVAMDPHINQVYAVISAIWSEFLQIQSALSGTRRAPLVGESGWMPVGPFDDIMYCASQGIIGAGVAMSFLPDTAGGLTGYSANGMHFYSDQTAAFKSAFFTSISSMGGTTVFGNGYLGLSSQGLASLSSAKTAIAGTAGVSIESQLNSLTMRSRTNAELSSSIGKVLITCNQSGQLNSISGMMMVHGTTGFYLGSGAESGVGVYGTQSELRCGYVPSEAKQFATAMPEANYLKATQTKVGIYGDDDSYVEVESGAITTKGTRFHVDHDQILLG